MRVVRTPEGFLVDEETGIVVEDKPIDFEHPEYRVYDSGDIGKVHYEPMKRVDPLESVLSLGDLPPSISIVRNSCRDLERRALELGGLKALAVFKCLRNMGADPYAAFYAIEKAVVGGARGSGKWVKLAYRVAQSIDYAKRNALVRWVARPDKPINLRRVATFFNAEVRRSGGGLMVLVRCSDLGVQIMRTKIDISAKLSRHGLVTRVAAELERKLGVRLVRLEPMVATVVLRPPFEINLSTASILGEQLRGRVKIAKGFWTAIAFRRAVNIYVKGDTSRISYAVADCLPLICLCANR